MKIYDYARKKTKARVGRRNDTCEKGTACSKGRPGAIRN